MLKYNKLRLTAAGALYCSAILSVPSTTGAATFLFSDITNWIGPAAGAGISQAALVIQWPGQTAWAWGYRWDTSTPKTGQDALLALAGVDPRLSITISSSGTNLEWDTDRNGTPDLTFPPYNPTTFEYLSYWVNNDQQAGNYTDGAAPTGAHLLPPLGSPYDEAGPGRWIASNTGQMGRPLADGSWDGWVYSKGDGTLVPALPINGPTPIPEPSGVILLSVAGSLLLRRRR